ncbi:hypothetical protein CS8_033300 [Cupriavidus sp. 8B]
MPAAMAAVAVSDSMAAAAHADTRMRIRMVLSLLGWRMRTAGAAALPVRLERRTGAGFRNDVLRT